MRDDLAIHDLEMERALLGGLIRSPRHLTELGDLSGVWFSPVHRALYRLLRRMPPDSIDSVSVPYQAHQAGGALDGEVAYISSLPGKCPSTANLGHYAGELRRLSVVRQGRLLGDQLEAVNSPAELRELARRLLDLSSGAGDGDRSVYLAEVGEEEIRRMQEGGPGLVQTGLADFDREVGGLQRQSLTIVCGRPGMGKSALAECWAEHLSSRGHGVAYCSLELSRSQMWQRQITRMTGVPTVYLRSGKLYQSQWDDVVRAQEMMRTGLNGGPWAMKIHDAPAQRVSDVESHALATARALGGLGLVVVDYLQNMGVDRGSKRHLAVGEAAYGLRDLAKALDVAVVAVAQLNRGLEGRADKRPKQSDLYESDKLNQAADLIIGCHRPHYYEESEDPELIELCVLKNRFGAGGAGHVIKARWDGPRMRVEDRSQLGLGEEEM